jgi:hypothetical protein
VKGEDLFVRGIARLEQSAASMQSACLELAQKCAVAVGAERVSIAEAVARETFAYDDC